MIGYDPKEIWYLLIYLSRYFEQETLKRLTLCIAYA